MSWNLVDKSLVIQTIIYFGIIINGLASVISAILSKNGFGGLCILYGEASCSNITKDDNNSNTTSKTSPLQNILVTEGQVSVCHFIAAINILVCIFYAFGNAVYHAHSAKKSAYQIRVGYQMWTKALAFGSCLSLVLVMSSACMVTVGLSKWCIQVMEELQGCEINVQRCSDTQLSINMWKWMVSSPSSSSSSSTSEIGSFSGHYLDLYEVTETTSWINVALWLVHIAVYVHRLFKQRYVQTSYQEPFTADFLDAFT